MRLAWGTVVAVVEVGEELQRLEVVADIASPGRASALCYPALTGACRAGDRVLLNTTAVDLRLGTGGEHFVVARSTAYAEPGSGPFSGLSHDLDSGGHVMKARYTPLQVDVLAVEEGSSPHHGVMAEARDVAGMPVVCCGLHSQMVPAAASVKTEAPALRVAYVMTDQGSLPLALSDAVREARAAGIVDVTVTCGQAFGGELEAVTTHSGLLAARHVAEADVAIVAIGPGVTGTATPFGHGGVAQGEAINAAAAVGGSPVAALRLSFADSRPRHTPVSHHSTTALAAVALARAIVAVPVLPAPQAVAVAGALETSGVWDRHDRADARRTELPDARGVDMRCMGRTPDEDPAFFLAAAAAGEIAARLAAGEAL